MEHEAPTEVAEGELDGGPLRTIAVLGVAGLAVALAVLPVVVGLGLTPAAMAAVVAGVGSLVAGVGGVKLAVLAWGLATQAVDRPRLKAARAAVD